MFQCLDCYTVSFAPTGLCDELYSVQRKRDRERFMPGLTVSAHAWRDRSGDRFFVYNIILYEAALRGPAGGECVFL